MTTEWTNALGTSEIFLDFQDRLALLAGTERPLLVMGERGTGKELAVQRLHYSSARWDKPLVTVLCPALSPALLESELFGHEAGAFTGARGRHPGFFERADKGTLFLDEVADMPLPLQDKLLRVLEYGSFERVGGVSPVQVDVRVVAATNRDLPGLAAQGGFRPDLLDRLAFDVLHVPPLRARREDKLLLARHFAAGMAMELGLTDGHESAESEGSDFSQLGPWFGKTARHQLDRYSWPGNVRELKNVVERTVARRRTIRLETLDLDPFLPPYRQQSDAGHAGPHARSTLPGSEAYSQAYGGYDEITSLENFNAPLNGDEMGGEDKKSDWIMRNMFAKHDISQRLDAHFKLNAAVERLERNSLLTALHQAKYKQVGAARLLGLSYHQFRALYRKHRTWVQQAELGPDQIKQIL